MGLLVTNGILPCGVAVNNVYMTFSDFPIYLLRNNQGYLARGTYTVYSNITQRSVREMEVDLIVPMNDLTAPMHSVLYNELKKLYPNSTNA